MFTKEQVDEISRWLIINTNDGVYYSDMFKEEYGTGEKFEMWPTFDDFWNEYDKKVGDKEKLAKKWAKIAQKYRLEIMEYIPRYKKARPDKKYRKDPMTFLNNKSWNDEIVGEEKSWFQSAISELGKRN